MSNATQSEKHETKSFAALALRCWLSGTRWRRQPGSHFQTPTPVPNFLNPDLIPKIFQIWESVSNSDRGYHRCNRNWTKFLPKKRHV